MMGMIIAWQCVNRLTNLHDGRLTDTFLIVTPGIPVEDRLRVLLPGDSESTEIAVRKLSSTIRRKRAPNARPAPSQNWRTGPIVFRTLGFR